MIMQIMFIIYWIFCDCSFKLMIISGGVLLVMKLILTREAPSQVFEFLRF